MKRGIPKAFTSWTGVSMTLTAWVGLAACHGPQAYLKGDRQPMLSYERTMCFGPCPSFRLEVDRSGAARFNGRAHVEPLGAHTATWSEVDIRAAADLAAASRLNRKVGTYDNPMIMDLPATRLSFGEFKVMDRIDGPDLEGLYALLDSLIAATDWMPETKGDPSGQR